MSVLESTDVRIFEATKSNGYKVWARIRRANRRELEAADMENSRIFNQSLIHGLPPRARLLRILREQELWTTANDENIASLRATVAKSETAISDLDIKLGALVKASKEPGATPPTDADLKVISDLNDQKAAINESRIVTYKELRQLRVEIDAMLGHTADAKAEDAQRNCLLACVSELVDVRDGVVTKVKGRIWDSIELMLEETDSDLLQRVMYEYMTFVNEMPSEWENDKAVTKPQDEPAPQIEPEPQTAPTAAGGDAVGAPGVLTADATVTA